MNKKIMIIANNSGGLFGFRSELIKELVCSNCAITALTPLDDKVRELQALGIQLIDTPINRRGINPVEDIRLFFKYYNLIKREKPQLLITYTIKPNIYAGIAARLLQIPYVANITGIGTAFQNENRLKQFVVFLYRLALKKAKVLFFENEENRAVFLREKIATLDKTCVLNGAGVNLDRYAYTPYPENSTIRFLFMGRIMQEKGIDELLYSAVKIKKEYPDVQFDLLGNMEEDYQKVIQRAVDNGVINYYGYQSDVRPFIEKCHCFVLPSYHEGMANTLLESAAMGRPLITSDIHGCKEAVVEGENGYLVEKGNAEELYKKMRQFIELDVEEKKTMGVASRKHMELYFDKKKVVAETMKYLFL